MNKRSESHRKDLFSISRLPDAPLDTRANWTFETWPLTLLSGHLVWHIQFETNSNQQIC